MKKSVWSLILIIIISKLAFSQSIKDIKHPIWKSKDLSQFIHCSYMDIDDIIVANDSIIDITCTFDCAVGLEPQCLIISLNNRTGEYLKLREYKTTKFDSSTQKNNQKKDEYLSEKKIYKIEEKFIKSNKEVTIYSKWFHTDSLYLYLKVFNINNKELIYDKVIDTIGYQHSILTRLTDDVYINYFSNSSKVTVNITNGERYKSRNEKLYSNVIDYEKINALEIITKENSILFKTNEKKVYKIKNNNSENRAYIYSSNNFLYILRGNILTKHKLKSTKVKQIKKNR